MSAIDLDGAITDAEVLKMLQGFGLSAQDARKALAAHGNDRNAYARAVRALSICGAPATLVRAYVDAGTSAHCILKDLVASVTPARQLHAFPLRLPANAAATLAARVRADARRPTTADVWAAHRAARSFNATAAR